MDELRIKDWFKDHVAIHEKFESKHYPLERISWRNKNGSSSLYIEYIKGNTGLFISGDLGTTTILRGYSFEWFANNKSPHYLREKIEACSELASEKLGTKWDNEEARKFLEDSFKDWMTDFREEPPIKSKRREKLEDMVHLRERLLCRVGNWYELSAYMIENGDEMEKVFGQDWWEYGFHDAGIVLSDRVFSQQIGLKMALEQLGIGK